MLISDCTNFNHKESKDSILRLSDEILANQQKYIDKYCEKVVGTWYGNWRISDGIIGTKKNYKNWLVLDMTLNAKEVQPASGSVAPLNPDWVSMDIDKLGKSMYSSEEEPLDEAVRTLKSRMLMKGMRSRRKDVIVECSRSTGGLVNNENRMVVWPFLLCGESAGADDAASESDAASQGPQSESQLQSRLSGVKLDLPANSTSFLDDMDLTDQEPHPDEDQVRLDIQRSFTVLSHLQSFNQMNQSDSYTTIFSNSDVDDLKKKLFSLVVKILRKYPSLNYYQGYHDVASTILLVCCSPSPRGNFVDEQAAFELLEKFTLLHLRDFMLKDISLSTNHLKLIPTILESADPDLFELVKQSSNSYILGGDSYFDYNFYPALSSILTLFSHDIAHIQHVLLIWDFILSYFSVMTTEYIYVAALIYNKEEILSALNLSSGCHLEEEPLEFDKDLAHALLSPSKLFETLNDRSLIKILNRSKSLIETVSTSDLDNSIAFSLHFKDFNKHSVLLTTSSLFPENNASYGFDFSSFYSGKGVTAAEIATLIEIQDEEVRRQVQYQAELDAKLAAQQEELTNSFTTEYDSSNSVSLSSSLSSLASTSSTLNNKLVKSSSLFLRKLFDRSGFSSPNPDDLNNIIVPRSGGSISTLYRNIPKVSITVGFIGFVIHFLMVKNDLSLRELNISKMLVFYIGSLKSIGKSLLHYTSIDGTFYDARELLESIAINIKDSTVVRSGISVGQVGIHNVRNSIFGFHP